MASASSCSLFTPAALRDLIPPLHPGIFPERKPLPLFFPPSNCRADRCSDGTGYFIRKWCGIPSRGSSLNNKRFAVGIRRLAALHLPKQGALVRWDFCGAPENLLRLL